MTLDAPANPPELAAAARVLVVDDEEMNRAVLLGMLARLGVRSAGVASGAEALEILANERFTLVLLDGRMPGMDGAETARRIRLAEARNPGRPPLRVIGVLAEPQDAPGMRAAGCDEVLEKPVRLSALLRVLPDQDAQAFAAPLPRTADLAHPLASRMRAKLRHLAANGKTASIGPAELLSIFRTSVETHRDRLVRAVALQDWSGARGAAHTLAGASGYLDAHELETRCRDLLAVADTDPSSIRSIAQAIQTEVTSVLAAADRLALPGGIGD